MSALAATAQNSYECAAEAMMRSILWLGVVLCAASCGGKGSGGTDGGGQHNAPSSLVGTWDVTTTSDSGSTSTATVTIADGSVTVTTGLHSVTFDGKSAVSVMWDLRTLTGTHSATGDAGFLPINPLGDWSVSDSSGGLTASMTSSSITGSCSGDCSNNVTGQLGGQFTGTKTAPAAASSSWGDLAGTWHVADSGGYACDATLVNATFQASCGLPGDQKFTITASVSGDMLSGTASRWTSYELSAHRR